MFNEKRKKKKKKKGKKIRKKNYTENKYFKDIETCVYTNIQIFEYIYLVTCA